MNLKKKRIAIELFRRKIRIINKDIIFNKDSDNDNFQPSQFFRVSKKKKKGTFKL